MEKEEYPVAKFIRLQNGDDIVAETVEMEDEDGIIYMLCNPLKVIYTESSHHGYLSVSFIPWVFTKICDHQEFMIHSEDVMLVSNVSEQMNHYYWNNIDTLTQKIEETSPESEQQEVEETVVEALQQLAKIRTYH
jgi:hypothetical protein